LQLESASSPSKTSLLTEPRITPSTGQDELQQISGSTSQTTEAATTEQVQEGNPDERTYQTNLISLKEKHQFTFASLRNNEKLNNWANELNTQLTQEIDQLEQKYSAVNNQNKIKLLDEQIYKLEFFLTGLEKVRQDFIVLQTRVEEYKTDVRNFSTLPFLQGQNQQLTNKREEINKLMQEFNVSARKLEQSLMTLLQRIMDGACVVIGAMLGTLVFGLIGLALGLKVGLLSTLLSAPLTNIAVPVVGPVLMTSGGLIGATSLGAIGAGIGANLGHSLGIKFIFYKNPTIQASEAFAQQAKVYFRECNKEMTAEEKNNLAFENNLTIVHKLKRFLNI
jgi:hypothetical protein